LHILTMRPIASLKLAGQGTTVLTILPHRIQICAFELKQPRIHSARTARSVLNLFFACCLVLVSCSLCEAGLFGGAKAVPGPGVDGSTIKPLSFGQFREYFTFYTVDILDPKSSTYKAIVGDRDRLRALAKRGTLTTPDALDLSVALMRLREFDEAVQVLTPLVLRERSNFMLISNLASANQASGKYDRASEYLQQVLDVWPREWPGLSKSQLDWYHEVTKYQLRLVKKRYRESLQKAATAKTAVDDLFESPQGAVQFKAEDGAYQAGKLAEAERKKLPPNALAIVQQLVLWFPDDTRLYWQLGELYNAEGDIAAAATILNECVWTRRDNAPLLQEHKKIVQLAVPKQSAAVFEDEPAQPSKTPVADPNAYLPEKRQLVLVGGVAGTIILVLIFLQIREIRLRRQRQRK
jgi:tetratricopeptide (TPR) repeat protein